MRADEVIYDERTGVVTAAGSIKIRDPQGNVLSAEEIELTDTLKEGFVTNVRLLLDDGSRVAALDGERKGSKTRFNKAVYSPCHVCTESETPLWQIKAVKVIHDQEKKRLYYDDAYLEVLGLPILYLPYLSHPDPSVEKASGFLVPEFRQSRELGFVFEAPYFWNIDPHQDITLTPIITSEEGPVLGAEYRRHLGIGQLKASGSLTYVDERDNFNVKTGREELRGHFFTDGFVNLNDRWRTSYDVRWASDDTYLRRYDISNDDTLRSRASVEGFFGRSYFEARTFAFQGLRVEDIAGLTPFTLPEVNYFYESNPLWHSGRVQFQANALALYRTSGADTQRVSLKTAWDMPHIFANGVKTNVNASVRGDFYHVNDALETDNPIFAGREGTEGRFLPRLTLDASWPLINSLGSWTQLVEPLIQVVVAKDGGNPIGIPNEDSRSFDLDDSNLFSPDRYSGLDRWEGGIRATYGARWSVQGGGVETDFLIGQSIRFNENSVRFPEGTGLDGNFSDIVGRLGVTFAEQFEVGYGFRLDKDSLDIRRNEVDLSLSGESYRVTAGYIRLNRDFQINDLEDREEIRLTGLYRINENWSVTGGTIQDLTTGRDPISQSLGVIYSDECLELRMNYRKNFTNDRDFDPGTTVTFRIRLKNLG
jgi:LPS-assembly protein